MTGKSRKNPVNASEQAQKLRIVAGENGYRCANNTKVLKTSQ
jgi:hypothetical protein